MMARHDAGTLALVETLLKPGESLSAFQREAVRREVRRRMRVRRVGKCST